MNGPGKEHKKRDKRIAKLLCKRDREQQEQGLALLDEEFREVVTGWFRFRSSMSVVINEEDLADLWTETLNHIWTIVINNEFKNDGRSILALVLTIFIRRCIDLLRKRGRNQSSLEQKSIDDVELLIKTSDGQPFELLEEIESFDETLSEKDREKLRLDVELFLERGAWVTASELTKEFNLRFRNEEWTPVTVAGTRSWRSRIRKRLREHLRNREYYYD